MNSDVIDYFCIVFYLQFIVILGSCFNREQKTTRNYFPVTAKE
jgi:Na+/proline symporter